MNERKYKVSERTGVNNKQITQNGYNLILKEKNNLYELRMKEHINESNDLLGRIWRDIEYYELRLDSENKVVELINKEEILAMISDKTFTYLKEDKSRSLEIMAKVNHVKSVINSDDMLSLFNNRGIFAFIFMDRTVKNDPVARSLGGIIDNLLIPFNFSFSKIEENEKYLKCKLSSEIDPAKSSIINLKALFREGSKIPADEKLDLELSVSGIYIIDKEKDTIKDMKIDISFQMNEHNILTEYIMNESK